MTAEVLLDRAGTVQPVAGELGGELFCLETVFAWMHGEGRNTQVSSM